MSFRNPLSVVPVTITGTPNVAVTNTPNVAVSNTPNVAVSNTPNVAVSNTPDVDLAPGAQLTSAGIALQAVGEQLLSGDLGTGADGAVTISVNTTLTRDMNYSSLTVNNGITLSTGGYVIRCTGTIAGAGTIDNSGTNATTAAAGVGGATGSLSGGAAGVFLAAGTSSAVDGTAAPAADVQGGAGGSVDSNNNTFDATGGAVTPNAALGGSVSGLRSLRYAGGASGGIGKSSTTQGVGTGGAGGVVLIICATFNGPTVRANAGTSTIGTNTAAGAGGSGGGAVFVFCRTYTSGSVQAQAAAGVAASAAVTFAAANGQPGRAVIVTTS